MSERRRYERVECSIAARWQGLSGTGNARITDLGAGGCFLESVTTASFAEYVSLDLNIDNEVWFSLRGEVIYSLPAVGFGLRFVNLTRAEQELVRQLIDEHQPTTV